MIILTGKRILRTSWSPAGVNSSVTRWESESVLCYSVAHFLWASVMHVCVCVAVTQIQWSVCPDPYTKASKLSNRYLATPLPPHHLWLINITLPFLHTLLLTLLSKCDYEMNSFMLILIELGKPSYQSDQFKFCLFVIIILFFYFLFVICVLFKVYFFILLFNEQIDHLILSFYF